VPAPAGNGNLASLVEILFIAKDGMVSPFVLSPVSQLRPTADWQNTARNESGLGRKEEYRSIRDDVSTRALPKQVDVIEVLPDAARIPLLRTPSFQHWSPNSRGANGIHPNGISCVVSSHGLGE
jgi:hypothetical protein